MTGATSSGDRRYGRALAGPVEPCVVRLDALSHREQEVLRLLPLHARGPMTITELARSVQLTHSAVSQKVAAMRAAGWDRTTAGTDARSKKVALTARASRIAAQLAAEWRAAEAAIAEIEAEIPYPLSQVITDIEQALQRKSFHDRTAEKRASDPAWKEGPDYDR